jgi:hypothetical protein
MPLKQFYELPGGFYRGPPFYVFPRGAVLTFG